MIYGIGCDIVQIDRIAAILKEHGERFLYKVYTESEIAAAPQNQELYIAYLAKRYAAKEAAAKAAGCGIGESLTFQDIEIGRTDKGQPIFTKLGNFVSPRYTTFLSLSDEKEYALAYVVIQEIKGAA
jgi:holo-[acyl-carrier protein] synthase